MASGEQIPRCLRPVAHIRAASGPAVRSAPVATILPGDAAAVHAVVCMYGGSRAPLLLIGQVRSAKLMSLL